jgi:hypothetical protein
MVWFSRGWRKKQRYVNTLEASGFQLFLLLTDREHQLRGGQDSFYRGCLNGQFWRWQQGKESHGLKIISTVRQVIARLLDGKKVLACCRVLYNLEPRRSKRLKRPLVGTTCDVVRERSAE